MKVTKKGRIGSSFDDYLKEEGVYEEVTASAIKRVIARQLDALMRDEGLTKSTLARRMKTSRAQLDRLLIQKTNCDTRHAHACCEGGWTALADGVGLTRPKASVEASPSPTWSRRSCTPKGRMTCLLDSDNVRHCLTKDLGITSADQVIARLTVENRRLK